MSRSRFAPPRPRSVWFALATGTVAVIVVAATVFFPLMGLIAAASGAAWFVRVPFGTITVVALAGYLLAAGLLALIIRSRRGPVAWILAVAATIAATVVSLYPAVAVAIAATDRASDIVPYIGDLITRGTELFS